MLVIGLLAFVISLYSVFQYFTRPAIIAYVYKPIGWLAFIVGLGFLIVSSKMNNIKTTIAAMNNIKVTITEQNKPLEGEDKPTE
ncbi:MAG: hypothetical protein LBB86_08335 [Oscillospiraceae bacterium]|jgi:hypothetical protein|nr:hypothetical protein [Oscillospiraceae bacterium]